MLRRVLTAALLIPIVVALVWLGPPELLAAVAAGIAILALVEFFHLSERMGLRGFREWTIFCSCLIFYAQYSTGLEQTHYFSGGISVVRNFTGTVTIETVLLVFLFGCIVIGVFTRRPLAEILPGLASSAAGLIFVALPFSYLVRINEVGGEGRILVIFTLCIVWAGDMLAYFVGRFLGRLPMAPALSPKKTWEGAFANVIASLLVALAFARWMQVDTMALVVVAALANIAGQAGDLIESAYKRGAAVKDSGGLLPGHGGVLDRVDSLILAAPATWVLIGWLIPRR